MYTSSGLIGLGSGGGGAGGPTEGSMALGLPALPLPPLGLRKFNLLPDFHGVASGNAIFYELVVHLV